MCCKLVEGDDWIRVIAEGEVAVSYTHLDVYKRQAKQGGIARSAGS